MCNVQPKSRGHLRLRSADPATPPAIKPNYLATDEDRRVAANSIRTVRRIVAQPALAPFHPQEYLPGPAVGDDEAALVKAAGDVGTTIFHPVGTAKMGRDSDPNAVVDATLRVIGLDGLRVIDASVMPTITSGNTNSPTMMIAEKGAALILREAVMIEAIVGRVLFGDIADASNRFKLCGNRFSLCRHSGAVRSTEPGIQIRRREPGFRVPAPRPAPE